ncbi:peptidase [Nostoc sp. UHCC 0870]|uniref:peptidase n=1 Tax=Nostoc sp. UHCC 0870 TaxID=2914041 RepID=UPI001EDD0248|nr:peptidase [Nostoc sp. UHCC 0870]UKO98212.1 peptidase [Nostoc sp. UHCC 0870]
MKKQDDKKSAHKLKSLFIYGISSSLIISSYILPISAENIQNKRREFIIASLPIDDPTLKQGINEIKVPEAPKSQKDEAPIKAPINPNPKNQPNTSVSNNINPNRGNSSTSNTSNNSSSSNNRPTNSSSSSNNRPANNSSSSNNRPANNSSSSNNRPVNNSSSSRSPNRNNRGSSRTPNPVTSTNSSSKEPTYRNIDFVDIPFGILSPGDFKSEGRYFHFYRFEGQENQVIQLRLTGSVDKRRTNNLSLQPYMFLLDPDNNVILRRGSSDKSKNIRDASIFAKLPAKGSYTIAVTSQNPGDIGRYTLALRNDRASYIEDDFSELTDTSPTLQNGNSYNVTKLEGKKGQLVSIRADSVFEDFSPFIVLLDAKGKVVSSDSEREGQYSALIDRAKLPDDGTYYVVVFSKTATRRGRYRLTIF